MTSIYLPPFRSEKKIDLTNKKNRDSDYFGTLIAERLKAQKLTNNINFDPTDFQKSTVQKLLLVNT